MKKILFILFLFISNSFIFATDLGQDKGDKLGIVNISTIGAITGATELPSIGICVDVSTDTVVRNKVLKWNGSRFVLGNITDTDEFTVAINTFSDNENVQQLIGDSSGVWRDTGTLTFDVTYTGGIPDSASIALTSNGGVSWGSDLDLLTPFATVDSAELTNYPTNKDENVTFTLTQITGGTPTNSVETVTFLNYKYWGVLNKNSGINSADILTLAGYELSTTATGNKAINAGVGEYAIYANEATETDLSATGFIFQNVTCGMQAKQTVSVTNTAGKTADYDVYASSGSNYGNSTLQVSITPTLINYIFYGASAKNSGFTESDIESLSNSLISNDHTSSFAINATGGTYPTVAYPKRLGLLHATGVRFLGMTCAIESVEEVELTNAVFYTETYYVYSLSVAGLGSSNLETSSSSLLINEIHYGVSTTTTAWSSAEINALSGSVISNTTGRSVAITAGASDHIVYAIPSRLTSVNATGWLFNLIAAGFNSAEIISVTNICGYVENYKVYGSIIANMGSSTLTVSTISNLINYFAYGVSTTTGTFLSSDIAGLANLEVTNDNTQIWNSVSPTTNEHIWMCTPARLGTVTFWIGGFEGGFLAYEITSYTNTSGYTEPYFSYSSAQANLGATVVETR